MSQLGISIIKLKQCWDQIRDAPEDLKFLIREIKLFSYVLDDIEADMACESVASSLINSKPALQCFKLCSEAATILDVFISDLGRDIDSSSRLRGLYAAAKMVMQKKKVEHYRARLQNVAGLLSLSQQCYVRFVVTSRDLVKYSNDYRALIQVQPELIAKKVALQIVESQNSSALGSNLIPQEREHHSTFGGTNSLQFDTIDVTTRVRAETGSITRMRHRYHAQDSIYSWRFLAPSWVTTKALEIAGFRAPDGWRFTLRSYKIVSIKSKAVEFAGRSDIRGLQELFTSGQASPFDRIETNGYTLLHVGKHPEFSLRLLTSTSMRMGRKERRSMSFC